MNSSYIFMISLQTHLKDTVLRFQKGQGRRPRRASKVVVYRGNFRPPRVEEYFVGPLPVPTYARLVMSPAYRRVPIPFSSRPVDAIEKRELLDFLSNVTEKLHAMFRESYGLSYHNCSRKVDCITFRDFAPRGTSSGERTTWFWAYRLIIHFINGQPIITVFTVITVIIIHYLRYFSLYFSVYTFACVSVSLYVFCSNALYITVLVTQKF